MFKRLQKESRNKGMKYYENRIKIILERVSIKRDGNYISPYLFRVHLQLQALFLPQEIVFKCQCSKKR